MLLQIPDSKKQKAIAVLFLAMFIILIFLFFSRERKAINENSETAVHKQQESLGAKTMKISQLPHSASVIIPPDRSRSVYLGIWTEGFWDDQAHTFHPEKLIHMQNRIGKKFAIAHYYTGWENLGKPSIISELQTISDNNWQAMVSVNPYFFTECHADGKTIYRAIAEGDCDMFLHTIGRNIKQYGKSFFLRFAWEMNIDSIEWSMQKTGSKPDDYIKAWRRFHDILAAEGAKNVIWVWSPNTITSTSIPYNLLYPGDAYVDWLGLDGYNWGNTQTWSIWQNFSQVFTQSYISITKLAPDKPLMLGEVNTTDKGGDKASWYKDMLATQLPYNFPQIKAVVFYNENRSKTEHVNWLIDITPQSLQAFSELIKDKIYVSSF